MSGIDLEGLRSAKGGGLDHRICRGGSTGPVWRSAPRSASALRAAPVSDAVRRTIALGERISREGGTPLAVVKENRLLG